MQYYTFYDVGKVWSISSSASFPSVIAASAGVGARLEFNKHLAGDFFVAKPLTRPAATVVAAGDNGNAPRAFFQVRTFF